ncbi:MAG TPA: hypothetical protein VL335_03860 [Candidatus Paceibacterota bacterium]|nr:hypothetical protein [Candidatus Paceibacterota bacterium]
MTKYLHKNKPTDAGIMLVDIIVALALAAVFVTSMSESFLSAQSLFWRSRQIDQLLSSTTLVVSTKVYGNDRIEVNTLGLPIVRVGLATTTNLLENVAQPLCSVDFMNHSIVGSNKSSSTSHILAHIIPIVVPINPSVPLTDLQVRNGIAYISANSSTVSDPDLFTLDFRDRTYPKILSSINTGPGIVAIALSGNRIYAASQSTENHLNIVRLDRLDSMSLESNYRIPPPLNSTSTTRASSIYYNDNKVYMGTEKWSGDGLSVIDVSRPQFPTRLGGLYLATKVNDVLVQGNFAYLADSDNKQMRVLNVTDPAHVSFQSIFLPSGGSRQDGKALSMFEGNLDLGRTSGGFDITSDHEFFIMNISTPPAPQLYALRSVNIPGGVYGIVQDRFRSYLATREVDKELQVFDRLSATTTLISSYSLPVAPQRMTCDGTHVYVLAATAPVIYEISFN